MTVGEYLSNILASTNGTAGVDEHTRYRIIARNQKGQAHPQPDELETGEWIFNGNPLTKAQFVYKYGHLLDPGIKYLCVVSESKSSGERLDFDRVQWAHEAEELEPTPLEKIHQRIDELASDVAEIPIEDRILYAYVLGDIDRPTVRQLVDLYVQIEASARTDARQNYADEASLDEAKEVFAGITMNLFSGYDSINDVVEDLATGNQHSDY